MTHPGAGTTRVRATAGTTTDRPAAGQATARVRAGTTTVTACVGAGAAGEAIRPVLDPPATLRPKRASAFCAAVGTSPTAAGLAGRLSVFALIAATSVSTYPATASSEVCDARPDTVASRFVPTAYPAVPAP